MFESLVKRRELEQRIVAFDLQKDDAIKEADYVRAVEIRNQMDTLKEELKSTAQSVLSLAELDQIIDLLQSLASHVALGDFLRVMAEDQFKDLRPLVGYLFPNLKILFDKG